MARLWSRKRNARAPADVEPAPEDTESVRLTGDEHAWWSESEVTEAWKPRRRTPEQQEAEEKRDILAEHFGEDWRTSFMAPSPEEDEQGNDDDPYQVLAIEPRATWEEIVVAHRHMARIHHPDRLFGQSDEEKAGSEERIRVINAAYEELRIRRGK